MKHIVRKAYWNYEKEEKWLNEMAAQGKSLVSYSWCRYVFEDTPKGEYIYRIELLDKSPKGPDCQAYIRFIEETGAEHIATYMRWVYFRKKAADGPFDIYTDIDSRIMHYKRVRTMYGALTLIALSSAPLNIMLHFANTEDAVHRFTYVNLVLGIFVSIVGLTLLAMLVLPLAKQIRRLKREKQLREESHS